MFLRKAEGPEVAANSTGAGRKDFLRGLGAAAVVGGVGGHFGGSSSSSGGSSGSGDSSKGPIRIGSGAPLTGSYAGDGIMQLRGQELAVAEINANGGVLGRQLKLSFLDTQAHSLTS